MAAEEPIRDKQARLHRMSHLLYRHPQGLTVREMAAICGVTPRTIQRDLKALEEAGVPIWQDSDDDKPRYGIVGGYYLPPLRLTLNEATVLYLAARLLTRSTDRHNPHVAAAVAQLASVLPETLGQALQLTVQKMAERESDAHDREVFEALALSWATGRKIKIWYRSAKRQQATEYTIHPYFIEPSDRATYVLGYSETHQTVVTFKVERIQRAQLLEDTYELPEGTNPAELLKNAWGIIYNDEVHEIILRFTPEVARRVDESTWHPSQKVVELPDGGRKMTLRVSGLLEIEPWIKTWGKNVEVLAPPALRDKIAQEAHELAALYTNGETTDERHLDHARRAG
jgi:predicted DNA-binding transcriptional regulator YafY